MNVQAIITEERNKRRWLAVNDNLTEESGIYILTRTDENGIKYAYVGQAKHILTRLAQHLNGYQQHIDLSLRKHGLYSDENPHGWDAIATHCPEEELDDKEIKYIKVYAQSCFQLLNKTTGGQGEGKQGIAPNKPAKGYYDGKKQGYEDARKFLRTLFDKNLTAEINGQDSARKQKALEKFKDFLGGHDEQNPDD